MPLPAIDAPAEADLPEVEDSDFGAFEEAVAHQQLPDLADADALAYWPGAPLTAQQVARHRAQAAAMREGRVLRFPAGLQGRA